MRKAVFMQASSIDELHNKYATYLDGYYLVGSSKLGIPFYKKEVEVEFIHEEQLDIVEEFIGKLISRGIQSKTQIGRSLFLPLNLLKTIIQDLVRQKYIVENALNNDEIMFTEVGREQFENNKKQVARKETFHIYFDGLTDHNEIRIVEAMQKDFVYWKQVRDSTVVNEKNFPEYDIERDFFQLEDTFLSLKRPFSENESDSFDNIKSIKGFRYYPKRELYYRYYEMLVYANKELEIQLLVYDNQTKSIQSKFHSPIEKKLLMGELDHFFNLNKILQEHSNKMDYLSAPNNEPKHIFVDEQEEFSVDNFLASIKAQEPYYIMNSVIRKTFLKFLDIAQHSIYIISPWMNNYVINKEFRKKLKGLLERGVKVRIIYGITDGNEDNMNERDRRTVAVARELIKFCSPYGELFQIKNGKTHEKLLICDEKYFVNGSYNFLSYAIDENEDEYFRNEGCTLVFDEDFAKARIAERFDV